MDFTQPVEPVINTSVRHKGFTIVELLIVIVVIAILAAISIVAYNGIQNRANDSTVQNDMATYIKKITLYYVDKTAVPVIAADFDLLEFKASKGSYLITPSVSRNMIFCPSTVSGEFAVLAKSKSNNAFVLKNTAALESFTPTWNSASTGGALCDAIDGAGGIYTATNAAGYWTGYTPNWASWMGA